MKAAELGDYPIDPPMRAWIDEFLAAGWTVSRVGYDFVDLAWPSVAREVFPGAMNDLMVPTRVEHEHYEAVFSRMARTLGSLCELVGVIRDIERRVYDQHIEHGWRRERPIRWPSHMKENRR